MSMPGMRGREGRFVRALIRTYGTLITLDILTYLTKVDIGLDTSTATIAGISALVWINNDPETRDYNAQIRSLVPHNTARAIFLMGCVGIVGAIITNDRTRFGRGMMTRFMRKGYLGA